MHELGHTRSVRRADYLLQTPDAFIRAPLPGMHKATAIVHAAPALGARFVQYTAELEARGSLGPTVDQRFIYVLDGELKVDAKSLAAGDYVYLPAGSAAAVSAVKASRAAVFEKPYQPLAGTDSPSLLTGSESKAPQTFLNDDPALDVRSLIPDNAAFDFRVNTMTYLPGAALPAVEIHVMEHGLLMLAGGGIYRLGCDWHPVTAGDFIWMAAYCPQWFGALGKTPAKYLIYKDWDRHPR